MGEEAITTQGSAGTTTYALADNLGSVRDIVNTSSVVVDHIVYASGAVVTSVSNTAIHHWAGYAGYHTDVNTGLDYADHRWYDPAVGRWISEDPLGFGGGDPNVSRYVGNSPTNGIDPTGLIFWPSWDDYVHYLRHPSQMDPGLQTAQKCCVAGSAVAAAGACGLAAAGYGAVTVTQACAAATGLAGNAAAVATNIVRLNRAIAALYAREQALLQLLSQVGSGSAAAAAITARLNQINAEITRLEELLELLQSL